MLNHREQLQAIRTFPQLVKYLRDELDWPISQDDFEDLTFEYTPEELGIDIKVAAKIQEIRRLRPLSVHQPWGIFFVKFEPKRLPVVAMRRMLNAVALKNRASAANADKITWASDDLLFISNYGEEENRQITFAHFTQNQIKKDLPILKVLGWDNKDTALHMDYVAENFNSYLKWPEDEAKTDVWRRSWRSAFTLKHREVIDTAKKLSVQLAHLARNIRERINTVLDYETESGPITKLMNAFKEALVHDLDNDGFADMYAQTIAYGLLSARISNPSGRTADDFASAMPVTNPFLKELMETFVDIGGRGRKKGNSIQLDFDELGVSEVVDLLDAANMEAVVLDFGDKNPLEDPVIHFYELFLKEYDAKMRMQCGVFYTPRPVVSYIVRSVDHLLRTEFDLKDGLADTTTWREMAERFDDIKIPEGAIHDQAFVQILDPATGTGTFLVEAIDLINKTMSRKWLANGYSKKEIDKLWNEYVPIHLLPRLHGYELLMAPYAIAHMKIGLKLYETGYLFESGQRASIFLTNALEPAQDFKETLAFAIPALAHEAQAVNEIKANKLFTVVIGNPPYSIQSQNLTGSARSLADPYRYLDGELIVEKGALQFEKALQDDFVKFASFSQQCIIQSSAGVLGMIMSHSFVDNPTLRGMRQCLGQSFNSIHVLDLHGNSTKKERCPDGSEDKNVFDIKQGVGILFGTSLGETPDFGVVRYGEVWGTRGSKYAQLEENSISATEFQVANPVSQFYLFKPQSAEARDEFNLGFKVTDIFNIGSVGIITARDKLVIDFESEPLIRRAKEFRDSTQSDEDLCKTLGISLKKGWDIGRARKVIKLDKNLEQFVKPLCYRPFDTRLIFYHPSLVWGMSYPTMQHMLSGGNIAMMVGRSGQVIGQDEWDILFCTRGLTEFNLYRRGGHNLFPLYLIPETTNAQGELGGFSNQRPNLASSFLKALSDALGIPQRGEHALPQGLTPESIFSYVYAVFHSPSYRNRYSEFLKIDFPRLPLIRNYKLLCTLSQLGGELIAVQLMESPRLEKTITNFIGDQNPKVEKISWTDNTVWLDKSQTTGFQGVRQGVWEYHIGGYQVCEKWLKDRKNRLLSDKDITHYHKIIIAISETIRIMAEIDEVIEDHGGWPGAFQTNN
jgi:predicted helicase